MLADHLDMAIVPEICQWSELLTEEAVFFAVQQGIVTPSTHVSTVLETDKVWFIEASYGHPRLGQLQGLQGPCFNPWDAPVSPMFAPVTPWMCIPVITVTKWPISRTFAGARTFLLRHLLRQDPTWIYLNRCVPIFAGFQVPFPIQNWTPQKHGKHGILLLKILAAGPMVLPRPAWTRSELGPWMVSRRAESREIASEVTTKMATRSCIQAMCLIWLSLGRLPGE